MFCPICGSAVPDGSKVCPECGSRLPDGSDLEKFSFLDHKDQDRGSESPGSYRAFEKTPAPNAAGPGEGSGFGTEDFEKLPAAKSSPGGGGNILGAILLLLLILVVIFLIIRFIM